MLLKQLLNIFISADVNYQHYYTDLLQEQEYSGLPLSSASMVALGMGSDMWCWSSGLCSDLFWSVVNKKSQFLKIHIIYKIEKYFNSRKCFIGYQPIMKLLNRADNTKPSCFQWPINKEVKEQMQVTVVTFMTSLCCTCRSTLYRLQTCYRHIWMFFCVSVSKKNKKIALCNTCSTRVQRRRKSQ